MRTRRALGIASLVLGGIVVLPSRAGAQEYGTLPPPPDVPGIPTAQRVAPEPFPLHRSDPAEEWALPRDLVWYGWQTLASDVAAMTMLYGGAASHTTSLTVMAVALYGFGAPAIHATREHYEKVSLDMSLRLLLPLAGAFLADAFGAPQVQACSTRSAAYRQAADNDAAGAAGGAVVAILLDAASIAFEVSPRALDARAQPTVRWSPSVSVASQGGTVGVGGLF